MASTTLSAPPYAPSWYDHLRWRIEKLPGPYWLYYLVLGLVLFAIETFIQWNDGQYPVGTLDRFHLVFCFFVPYLWATGQATFNEAYRALTSFREVINAGDDELK